MKRNEGISIERAKSEEEKFNWEDSAKIYEELLVESEYCENLHQASKLSKRLGYVNAQAADTMRTTGQYLEFKRRAIIFYKKASELYKKLENKADELECIAEALYEEGCCSSSVIAGEEEFKNSKEFFIQAGETFLKKGNNESYIRNLIRTAMCLNNLMKYAKSPKELETIVSEGTGYADKAWKISRKLDNFDYLIDSLYALVNISIHNCFVIEMPTFYNLNQGKTLAFDFRKWFDRAKITFELSKDQSNLKNQGIINFCLGFLYFYYGFFLPENISEQNHYIEEGLILCERGLDFIRKTKSNNFIIIIIFWLDWCAFFGGKINYAQKRIIQDLKEIKEAGIVYSNLFSFWNFYSNFLPALYYSNIAQRSFFDPKQRESYAKEALEFAKTSNSNVAYKPFSGWAYQILTWSYSRMVFLKLLGILPYTDRLNL